MNVAGEYADCRNEMVQRTLLERFPNVRSQSNQHVIFLLDQSDPRSGDLIEHLSDGVRQAAVWEGDAWIGVVPLLEAKALMPWCPVMAPLDQPLGPGKVWLYAVSGGHVALCCGAVNDSRPTGAEQLGDDLVATMPPDVDPPSNRRMESALRHAARCISRILEADLDNEVAKPNLVAFILDSTDDHPCVVDLVKSGPKKRHNSSDFAFLLIDLDFAREMVAVDAPELVAKINPTPPERLNLLVRVNGGWFLTGARLPLAAPHTKKSIRRANGRRKRSSPTTRRRTTAAGSRSR